MSNETREALEQVSAILEEILANADSGSIEAYVAGERRLIQQVLDEVTHALHAEPTGEDAHHV